MLYYSSDVLQLHELHPEVESLHRLGEETRFVVSEPLCELPGTCNEVPESSAGVVHPGEDQLRSFAPIEPSSAAGKPTFAIGG